MKLEQSAAHRTEVGPVQTIAVGPVETIVLRITTGAVGRVAEQLGYGVESVRSWVKQADIDGGVGPGVGTEESERVKDLEQEMRELRRANEILRRAATFFGAELDRQQRR